MHFKHKGLKLFFKTGSVAGIRPEHRNRVRLILGRLAASESPEDMALPGLGLHPLVGKRAGTWAVRVSGNWRITFQFKASKAEAINYEDYH